MGKKVMVDIPGKGNLSADDWLTAIQIRRRECDEIEPVVVAKGRQRGLSWGYMAGLLGLSERGLRKRYRSLT